MRAMRAIALSLAGGVLLASETGCVPYEKYRDTVAELGRVKSVNADLIKRYNSLMAKYLAKGGDASDTADVVALRAQIQQLEAQLRARGNTPAFRDEDRPSQTFGDEGGIAFGDQMLFTPGSAKLRPGAGASLDQMVDTLQASYSGERVIIEGHTDNTPLLKTEKIWKYNMNLAYNRALAVFEYFVSRGIPESRMIVHAYSFNDPLNPELASTDSGRKANRRVVVRRTGEIDNTQPKTAFRGD